MEDTLVLIKPDAVGNRNVGDIIMILEDNFLEIVCASGRKFEPSVMEELYAEHEGRPFYKGNLEFMLSGAAVALWLRGTDAIATTRRVIGATDPQKAEPNTIRWRYGSELPRNCIHASDSPESARRELGIFFPALCL